MNDELEKMKLHSPEWANENIRKLAEIFPNCVTETQDADGTVKRAIDYDQLRQEMSDHIVDGPQERYHLNWPGKREALLAANAQIAKTLRPVRDESVDFDTTQNLFIEGDNLEALKLLQETYLGKVKMIYIDPPYNTGNDFIYADDFATGTVDYSSISNQRDQTGRKLVANPSSDGRFHSKWLSMIYPRLRLARNLLRDDGVIFISMGDFEIGTLRHICDEIFGVENFEGHIHWRRRHNQPNDPTKMIGVVAEHILSYAKDKASLKKSGVGKLELTGTFSNPDNDPRGPWASKPWKVGSDQSGSRYIISTPGGQEFDEEWMGERSTYESLLSDGKIIFPNDGRGSPRKKYYQSDREAEGQSATNWWPHEQFGHNQEGNALLTELFDGQKNIFSNPKPPKLLVNLLRLANCEDNDIVLDFFLGSASTFHACCLYHFNLKFIGVQIAEELSDKVKEHQPAIQLCKELNLKSNIASVAKERMRRVGSKTIGKDIGFRVLKVDTSNMKDVYYRPDEVDQTDLLFSVDNIKNGRTGEDLLFQVLVDWGVDLTLSIRHEKVDGKSVYFVDDDALIACFETGINEDFVKQLANHKPLRVVFRDNGFASDDVKANIAQIFRQTSPDTDIKVI